MGSLTLLALAACALWAFAQPKPPEPAPPSFGAPVCGGERSSTVTCLDSEYAHQMSDTGCGFMFASPCFECCARSQGLLVAIFVAGAAMLLARAARE